MKRVIALLMAILMIGVIFAGCGAADTTDTDKPADSATPDSAETTDLAYVLANGKLVVGITEFEPMDYKDENGEWIGFDADMAKEFAKTLGVEVEFVEIDWDNKVLELDGKTVDCIWNGMTLTDEVKSSMSTSDPYCNNAQVVVVKSDVAANYADANACMGLNFAVESGSAGQEQAEAYGFTFTEVKDQATALMEVASGTCDAAIIDSLMAGAMIGEGTSYADLTYTVALNSEEYGVGFRTGSDITEKFNAFLADAIADGTVDKIAETYGVQAALIK
ncbi:MAG: transporter substrate-binding domain-containing protein [Ruminococcus sp.]|nr:transporter substrate-binding domain-containing protein [Ruminococcus sp.]